MSIDWNEYQLKEINKFKDFKKSKTDKLWFNIAVHESFHILPKDNKENQRVPSYSTYLKFIQIQKPISKGGGTDIENAWGKSNYKSISFLYKAIKKRNKIIDLPNDYIAVSQINKKDTKIVIAPEDKLPEESKVVPEGIGIVSPEFDDEGIPNGKIVMVPKNIKLSDDVYVPKIYELTIHKDNNIPEGFEEIEIKPDWLKKTTVWNFPEFDNRFGSDEISRNYPSRIPGQILMNLMYWYTKSGDLIIDPFGGSGTNYNVIDMSKYLPEMRSIKERKIICYDLSPVRDYIRQNDMTKGYPNIEKHFNEDYPNDEYKGVKLIFFDPPYWSMKDYSGKGFEDGSLDQFHEKIRKLAQDSYDILEKDGKIAFIIMDQNDKDTGLPIHHGINCYNIFKDVGFIPIEVIDVPRLGLKVTAASKEFLESRRLLGTFRMLFVMQK